VAEALIKRRSRRGSKPDARERELKRLRLSVCDDVGFRLLVATYDQPKRRDELIARLMHDAEAEKVRVTRLDLAEGGPETNLVGLLRVHVQGTDLPCSWRQAVMITGIEQRLDYSGGREGLAFLHQANLLRDALPDAAPMPVVLWLSRMASAALPAEAPDLWDWRAANFDFTGDEAPRLELLRELTKLQPTADPGLSGEQRRAHINMLEDLLAELEREGPPKSKRQAGERADLLVNLGQSLQFERAPEAIPRFEQALRIYRDIGDRRGVGNALGCLGLAWRTLGEPRRAIEYYEEALLVYRKIGDRRIEGAMLGHLGIAWANLGQPRRAIEYYEETLKAYEEVGERRGEGHSLWALGLAWSDLGEARQAIGYYERALRVMRDIGYQWGEGAVLNVLGSTWMDLGEPRRAIDCHEQALGIMREIGDRRGVGNALGNLGNAWFVLGEPQRAIEHYEQQLAIAHETSDRMDEGSALFNSALVLDEIGEREEGVRRTREALAIFGAIGAKQRLEKARAQLAEWEADDTEPSRASG
jgi:tetratricopeptide (TPR) repeat protein